MRVNLKVTYAEKEEAKRLGAQWDPGRRTWYVENVPDLQPFLRWITPQKGVRVDSKPGGATSRTDFTLPDCLCNDVAPWQHCRHTLPATTGAGQ